MLQQFIQDLQSLGLIDWVVTLTALIYVVLSARNNPLCWVFGIISCALWAYASYVYYDLYADALLQVFYVVMGFVGLYNWQNGQAKQEDTLDSPLPETTSLAINHASVQQHVTYITIGLASGLLFGYAFSYTAAAATYYVRSRPPSPSSLPLCWYAAISKTGSTGSLLIWLTPDCITAVEQYSLPY